MLGEIQREWKRFKLIMSFMTTIPLETEKDYDEKDIAKSLVYAPVVGLIIGAILLVVWIITSQVFPVQVSAALVIFCYILLTGGLHLDGLADSCDGVFSNRSREKMLNIMRDSRIGSNGVIGLVLVILLSWTCLSVLPPGIFQNLIILDTTPVLEINAKLSAFSCILLWPVSGRIGSIVSAGISNYARKEDGMGKSFIEILGLKEACIGGGLGLVLFILVSGWRGILLFSLTLLSTLLTSWLFSRKLGGTTGDTLGASCEINQVVFLLGYIMMGGL